MDEIPKLQKFVQSHANKKIKVIAIGLEDDDDKWNKLIKNYPEFTHVLGLGKWNNKIGDAYDVKETPTYFLLDKNKNIIEKPNDIHDLESMF